VTAPPGPFRPGFWRSPLRGPWLTAVLGSVLLVLMTVVAATGFLSHAAYRPDLGRNALVAPDLPLPAFFPSGPSWLYALNQGLHVNVGLIVIPVVLAKLWSVIPRLFVWPPATSPAQALERAAIGLLVASTGFQLATGVANIQYWYVFRFDFVRAHYYGGIVFVASFVLHVCLKLPVALRAYRSRGVLAPLRQDLARTVQEPRDDPLVAERPDPPTVSRRGLLAAVGGGAFALAVANAGESLGGPLRRVAFLAPRRAGGFPVNKTARGAGITPALVGDDYRLILRGGPRELALARADLLALPQVTHTLTLGCVEGWSTRQTWTGVPLAELARRAGVERPRELLVTSLQPRGVLRQATLAGSQVEDERSLLALKVGGEDLARDHGYPARIIVPALPGVHNTKWVGTLTFRA
jgi:DMSO/TMAO reductase YedYZ molybdopterin-dependent catalytic subunit